MKTAGLLHAALFGLTVTSTVGCDQVTKHIARTELAGLPTSSLLGGTLRLVLTENAGGFLSLGASLPDGVRTAVFVFGVGLGLLLAAVYLLRRPGLSSWALVGAALVCAGGVSNLLDRIFRDGRVTDFLIVGVGPVRTGVFNVADVAIMAGGIVLLLFAGGRTPGALPQGRE